jgi:hypothetical protein
MAKRSEQTAAELFFVSDDLDEELLPAGFYPSSIAQSRLRRSASGNRMIHVVHALEGVAPRHARLADYFVLDGASDYVLALTRRRLVQLYRAAGLSPRTGAPIDPTVLLGSRVDVRVEHDLWRGQPRLRVVEYRLRSMPSPIDDVPF